MIGSKNYFYFNNHINRYHYGRKKESQRIRMLELLTNEENNLMLYDALHDKDLTKFFYLLKQGYALTPFCLTA